MDKKAFFSSIQLKSEQFTLPTGDVIELRELTSGDRDRVLPDYKEGSTAKAQARMVALCCPDFSEEDIPSLLKLPAVLLDEMANVVVRLSGLLKEQDAKKE